MRALVLTLIALGGLVVPLAAATHCSTHLTVFSKVAASPVAIDGNGAVCTTTKVGVEPADARFITPGADVASIRYGRDVLGAPATITVIVDGLGHVADPIGLVRVVKSTGSVEYDSTTFAIRGSGALTATYGTISTTYRTLT